MTAQSIDLNLVPPDWDLNDWNATGESDGPVHELHYHKLRDDPEVEGGREQGRGSLDEEVIAGDSEEGSGEGTEEEVEAGGGDEGAVLGIDLNIDAHVDEDSHVSPSDGGSADRSSAGEQDGVAVGNSGGSEPSDGGPAANNAGVAPSEEGSNARKKRRYYSDDLKISIYLELLAKTDPLVLRRGVSKHVAARFGVPLRLVQSVWRNGQDYGAVEGVKNKLVKNCGRKRIKIDMGAVKAVPLRQRRTLQDLANALGVKKTTLHSRFKEGYLRRHTRDLKYSSTDGNKKAADRYSFYY